MNASIVRAKAAVAAVLHAATAPSSAPRRPALGALRGLALVAACVAALMAAAPSTANAQAWQSDTERATAIVERVMAAPDPQAALARLSAEDQELFRMAVTPVESKLEVRQAAGGNSTAFTGCWYAWASGAWHNVFGAVVFEFGQETTVCATNNNVYSVSITDEWHEVRIPGWRYHSHSNKTRNVGWEGRGLVQWHFILGAGGVDVQHAYPCVQLRLNGDGIHWGGNLSCSLS